VPRLEVLEDRTVPSTLTVTNNLDKGSGSLRDAITNAKSGDTIVFAPSLNGQTITLTSDQLAINNSLDIEGPGASLLAISGNDTNRVFNINEGLTVTIAGLTITHGRAGGSNGADSAGGGILNVNSSLTLANDVLSYNKAFNTNTTAGGAVANRNGGSLTVTGDTFVGNQAIAGGTAEGGAIANTLKGSMLTITNSTFTNNQAVGINGGVAGGGAIENDGDVGGASARISGSSFTNNMAIGGDGGALSSSKSFSPASSSTHSIFAGIANGGAIISSGPGTTLNVTNSSFTGNEAVGGNGASGGSGASFYFLDIGVGGAINNFNQSNLLIDSCNFSGNQAVGGSNATGAVSGQGGIGFANGGALYNLAFATVTNSAFDGNIARGGSANKSLNGDMGVGWAVGGAVSNAPFFFVDGSGGSLSVSGCTFTHNQAIGGAGNIGGPFGGAGVGGGLANQDGATAVVMGSTFSANQAAGATGSSGGNGADGLGGAIANLLGASLAVSSCTLSGNSASGGAGGSGANGGNGFGGGLYNDGTSRMTATGSTITDNQATGGAAGSGGSAGEGIGGGVYFATDGNVCLDDATLLALVGDLASTSNDDLFGVYTIC
jgi:hypothetical protein